jgi:hypothetical protein
VRSVIQPNPLPVVGAGQVRENEEPPAAAGSK